MTLFGDYTLGQTLQRSVGTVLYRAIRASDNQAVLLKVLGQGPAARELELLRNEWGVLRGLNLPSVPKAISYEASTESAHLVLEDFDGRLLTSCLEGPMPAEKFLPWAIALSRALAELHGRRVIHRDVNPQNVLVDPATGRLKLINFGLATELEREQPFPGDPRLITGTFAYMSPEQTGRMNRAVDCRTDLYSLGVTFYQMLTGRLPFHETEALGWVYSHIAREAVPVHEVVPHVPRVVSLIVAKLMSKMAEDRYASATGLKCDLERCYRELAAGALSAPFELGQHDVSDQFHLPQELYGREDELRELVSAFERVADPGTPEVMLVTGSSGIGKTALVQELYRPIVRARGYFISGKFDQYKRDIPYAIVTQACGDLVEQLLTESDERVAMWRARVREALGGNCQLVVDVVPRLEQIIGPQPPVPEMAVSDAETRLQLAFQNFLSVFAETGHPLVLFLDDLQWIDTASLKLVEALLSEGAARNLLVVGAYRDNEVTAAHPLARALDSVERKARLGRVTLGPLSVNHLRALISSATRSPNNLVEALAQRVHAKTAGSPFFVIQFLLTLHGRGLIWFDHQHQEWKWDLSAIDAAGFTDNVVDLMVSRVRHLPERTQQLLMVAAAVGNQVDLETVQLFSDTSRDETAELLWQAVREGLLQVHDRTYLFVHDRVQQAAYSLLSEIERHALHLRIARMLHRRFNGAALHDHLFEILDQYSAGRPMLVDPAERREVGLLNLQAAQKAVRSTAYTHARQFAAAAQELLQPLSWQSDYDLQKQLHATLAETEFLTGHLDRSQELVTSVLPQLRTDLERAEFYNLLIVGQTLQGEYKKAVNSGLAALAILGIAMPVADPDRAFREAVVEIDALIGERKPTDLVNLPLNTDPVYQVAQRVLLNIEVASYIGYVELYSIIVAKMVVISLTRGNAMESCKNYGIYGLMLGDVFGHYQRGFEFAQLGRALVDRLGAGAVKCKAMWPFTVAQSWVRPLRETFESWQDGISAGLTSGDIQFTAYLHSTEATYHYIAGDSLSSMQGRIDRGQEVARARNNQWAIETLQALRLTVDGWRTRTDATILSADETRFLADCESHDAGSALCLYHSYRAQRLVHEGVLEAALVHAQLGQQLTRQILFVMVCVDATFAKALALAGLLAKRELTDERAKALRLELQDCRRKLMTWRDANPANCEHKYVLVEAEIARAEGNDTKAMGLYESAIETARANGFVQDEALALKLAADSYRARGFTVFAETYQRAARQCYARWGADGVVQRLDAQEPETRDGHSTTRTVSAGEQLQGLDLFSVLKATQAISSEIVLPELQKALLRLAIENAGAHRGLLIRFDHESPVVDAEAETGRKEVLLTQGPGAHGAFPLSVVAYVKRTEQPLTLGEACRDGLFVNDPYVTQHKVKSVLCVPIVRQGKVSGVLYLENNLATQAFGAARAQAVMLLAGQAAISLENARLYADVRRENAERQEAERLAKNSEQQRREADLAFKAVVDQTAHLLVLLHPDGRVVSANRAALDYLGVGSADAVVGRSLLEAGWPTSGRASLREALAITAAEEQVTHVRADEGARILDVTCSPFRDEVGLLRYVIVEARDVSQLLEEKEQQARARRLELVGQLAGGVAHDFNNVLAVITGSTEILQRELKSSGALTADMREQISEVYEAAKRASDLTRRLLAFGRRAPMSKSVRSMHELLTSTLTLVRRTFPPTVRIEKRFAAPFDHVEADPASIESVFLNLAINARDAMPLGGTLTVSTSCVELDETTCRVNGFDLRPGPHLQVSVEDTGTGIAPQLLGRIFEPFFTTKAEGRGTGVGLASVMGTIQDHNGSVQVESDVGRGTVFHLTFPLAASAPLPEAKPERVRDLSGLRALVVDDEPALRNVMLRNLAHAGVEAVAAGDAESGLALFEAGGRFDFAVLDVVLPGKMGTELAAELLARVPNLPVLLVSAFPKDAALANLPRQQVSLLAKPFTFDTLIAALGQLLGTRAKANEA